VRPWVASDNPYWYEENMRYTRYAGGARCNVQMQAITGSVELRQWNGLEPSFPVDSATIGAQLAVPPGYGSGWQAYAQKYYTRTSDAQNLQIHLTVTLEIPAKTGARWNTVPNACERDANIRIIHCQLWSPPFRHAPYPCPNGRVGAQDTGCSDAPDGCSGPMYPGDNPEYQCPGDDDLPGKWGPEDGFYADLEEERQDLEDDTGQTVPGGPLPNASTASGNDNNDDDPHFEAPDTRILFQDRGFGAAEWCNSDYRVRRRWCYSEWTMPGSRDPDHRANVTGSKLRGTNSKAVYVCVQWAKDPVPSGKKYETCNTNIAKTGFHRLRHGADQHGECEHFHVRKQWVWCNWETRG